MTLTMGSRLGPYEIISSLGAGGMGEVYRARDAKLNREVAIKVLLPAVASDPDRLARFSREAQVLASLNHPNIAAIYGVEEVNGLTALVMELVEGEDLSQRIARGALPIDEALPIARQIAEALEAAHEQGIIHRDLKPANIKVRSDGTVKVLDFGLAKAVDPTAGWSATAMNSPTLSIHATQAGIILGTAAYMSPEQARGKPVDKRTDIWAFGCVLFEMLTGARAFAGDDVTDTIVSVVSKEPAWETLPPSIALDVRRLLARCLIKDPKTRLRDIGEARFQLEPSASGVEPWRPVSPAIGDASSRRRPVFWKVLPWALAAAAIIALGMTLAYRTPWNPAAPMPLIRFTVPLPAALPIRSGGVDRNVAMSPDGTRLVYASVNGRLVMRGIDQLEAVPLSSVSYARQPFFSADGKWVGFFDSTTMALKKVSVAGGPVIPICAVEHGAPRGGSWGADDIIVFATAGFTSGLWSVAASGGTPAMLTTPDAANGEQDHQQPSILPGGQAILFTIVAGRGETRIAVLDRRTGRHTTLIDGASQPQYVEPSGSLSGQPGFLLYASAGTLRSVRFDLKTLTATGASMPVADGVVTGTEGVAGYSSSRTGTLAYVAGGFTAGVQRSLVWVDRQGREDAIAAPARAYVGARLSPDATRLALDIRDQDSDIWTWDLTRHTLTRLTFDAGVDMLPIWTPDSRRIIFASLRAGASNLFWHAADGTGGDQRLTTSVNAQRPSSVSRDGAHVLGSESLLNTANDLMQFSLGGAASSGAAESAEPLISKPVEALLQTKFDELNADFSPDGRYFAYESNESGKAEIYVRPYPRVNDGRWQVSTGGGTRPAWARNGAELFYVDTLGTLIAVAVRTTGTTFSAGNPAKVFDTKYGMHVATRGYDVSADGRRFLMIKAGADAGNAPPTSLIVVANWFEELKAKVPLK